MTAAIFGLIGVVVGGLITWGIEFSFEKRRAAADLRQAKRLVGDEIQTIWMNLTHLVEERHAPTYPYGFEEGFLPTAAWEANKATLARHLSDDEWDELPLITHSASRLREMYARGEHGRELTPDEVQRNTDLAETAAMLYTMLTGKAVGGD